MFATGPEEPSLSWPSTASVKCFCGSRFATGVRRALVKAELDGVNTNGDEGDLITNSASYASLIKVVHDTLTKDVDKRPEPAPISFFCRG